MERTIRTSELTLREERARREHMRRRNDKATRGARRQIRRELGLVAERSHLLAGVA